MASFGLGSEQQAAIDLLKDLISLRETCPEQSEDFSRLTSRIGGAADMAAKLLDCDGQELIRVAANMLRE